MYFGKRNEYLILLGYMELAFPDGKSAKRNTIQGVVTQCLQHFCNRNIGVGAGRTIRGVHAANYLLTLKPTKKLQPPTSVKLTDC
jgi:tRNA U38,U39,U40 pseudouridine synthase TruA